MRSLRHIYREFSTNRIIKKKDTHDQPKLCCFTGSDDRLQYQHAIGDVHHNTRKKIQIPYDKFFRFGMSSSADHSRSSADLDRYRWWTSTSCHSEHDHIIFWYCHIVCKNHIDSSRSVYSRVIVLGERYDFVINAEQPVGAYWIQVRGLGECGRKRVQQLGILRYARGPYQPTSRPPTYDVGLPQGVVNIH